MDDQQIRNLVKEAPILAQLALDEISAIVDHARILRADKGTIILHEGQPGHGLFIILSGMVTVRRQIFGGFPVFANLYKNEVFGEISLLTGNPAGATVIAGTECWLLLLPVDQAQRMLDEGSPAIYKLFRQVVNTVQGRTLGVVERVVDVYKNPARHLPLFERMYRRMKK